MLHLQGFMVGEGGIVCWSTDRGVLWGKTLDVDTAGLDMFRVSQWANDSYATVAGESGKQC